MRNPITTFIDIRKSETLSRLSKDIKRYPLLSLEEETALARRVKAGDRNAADKLVMCNMRLLFRIAGGYQGLGVPLEDLISEGCFGLTSAASHFDVNCGCRFSTFAARCIHHAIQMAVPELRNMVRIPQKKAYDSWSLWEASDRLWQELRRTPTTQEIAAATGVSEDKVAELLHLDGRAMSIDTPDDSDSESQPQCTIALSCEEGADWNLMRESTKQAVKMALDKLPETEAKVLNLSFGIDTLCERTDREVGEMVGLSRERVRQIKVSALKRLRKNGDLDFLRHAA